MTHPIPSPEATPLDLATTFCSDICFHQSIHLPASPEHDNLRVTFATTRNFDESAELPVVLFCHPMGAARYLIYMFEEVARIEGVRVLIIDRPGFGGTTTVPLEKRVNTWLEIVPAVLKHLKVEHVALLSHSAGTIYAFNTAVKLSHLLYPGRPFMACLAPWVHPTHSSAPLMQVVDKLPSSWIGNFHHMHSFIGNWVAPSIAFSSAKMGVKASLLEEESQRLYGMSASTWDEVGKVQVKWQGKEDMSGVSADSLLCIQREGKDWGVYSSLPSSICLLREHSQGVFTVKVYFAETDVMIGKGGQRYFEKCWKEGNGQEEGNGKGEGNVRFEAKVVKGTDHDNIPLTEKGVVGEVFREVKKLCG